MMRSMLQCLAPVHSDAEHPLGSASSTGAQQPAHMNELLKEPQLVNSRV